MAESNRRGSSYTKLLAIFAVCLFIGVSGCTRMGGARIHVGPGCLGMEQLGYSKPFTLQDAKDIEALGYSECASFIRNSLKQKK